MKKRLLALGLTLACILPLCSCAVSAEVAALRGVAAQTPANLQLGAVTGGEGEFAFMVKNCFTAEEGETALFNALDAGLLSQEELSRTQLNEAVSRALFIRMTAAAAGGTAVPSDVAVEETWYAPWVRAGYALGLFGEELSFVPTDGFFMAKQGFAQMDAPISRGDAAAILAKAGLSDMIPSLEDGDFHGEEYLSVSDAVVCAWELHEKGFTPPAEPVPAVLTAEETLKTDRRIVHGGGNIQGNSLEVFAYSNAAEALVNSYHLGRRVLEFDFMWTSDGHLACVHNWRSKYSSSITNDVPMSLAEWLDVKVYDAFTPLCLESLAGFMKEHPDLYIVTDVKQDNEKAAALIAREYPELMDRFIIQIYRDGEYDGIRALGFPNIIYTTYNLSKEQKEDFAHLTQFAAEHQLLGYTYPLKYFKQEGYAEKMGQTGVMLFVHTVNASTDIQACYDAGITAVYTDEPQ